MRAADKYQDELNRVCPAGFRSLRVHDLKHTFGHRLRATGVGFEDRKTLLGYKSDQVTTHHSAPEISNRSLRPRAFASSRHAKITRWYWCAL